MLFFGSLTAIAVLGGPVTEGSTFHLGGAMACWMPSENGSKTPCGDTRRPPILNDLAALMYEFGCIRPGESEPSETLLLHAFACFRSFQNFEFSEMLI